MGLNWTTVITGDVGAVLLLRSEHEMNKGINKRVV